MKKSQVLVAATAVMLAALSWWLVRGTHEGTAAEASATPTRGTGSTENTLPGTAMSRTGTTPAETKIEAAPPAAPKALNWRKRLENSDDFWAFAESAIGPAKRGDGEARYWLALALNECEFVYSIYFFETQPGRPPRRRTLDEARQQVTQGSFYRADDINLLEKRCGRLNQAKDAPFGIGDDWMKAALAVDNPLAQANAAREKAESSLRSSGSEKAQEDRSEAIRLILDAVRTRDPEVLLRVGDAAASLAYGNEVESKRRGLSWTLAACLRTPDCEGLALWKKYRCNWDSQCQPYETPRDIIRRDAGSDFDEVERRARELNEKIDAGTLEEADL
jgi:hypothetical protein